MRGSAPARVSPIVVRSVVGVIAMSVTMATEAPTRAARSAVGATHRTAATASGATQTMAPTTAMASVATTIAATIGVGVRRAT